MNEDKERRKSASLESCVAEASCDELFDGADVTIDDVTAHAHDHSVSVAEPVLKMLSATQTSETTVDHDSQA